MPEPAPPLTDQSDFLPSLPFASWKDTFEILHMWTQMVGKVRLTLCPLVNHWWNVTFYVTSTGLTISAECRTATGEWRYALIS